MNTLILSAITAFIIIGAHIVTNWEGMLLHWGYRLYESVIDALTVQNDVEVYEFQYNPTNQETERLTDIGWLIQYLCKPIFTCPYCMSSLWTIAVSWVYCGHVTWFIIPSILITCGMVAVLWGAITYFKGG